MRTLTSIFAVLALTLSMGCGGGDGDGDTPDATPVTIDAGADAMPSGSSLANTCTGSADGTSTDCAAPFAACVAADGAPGWCTAGCAQAVAITSNGTGGLPLPQDATFHAPCKADYTKVGTPVCGIIVAVVPDETIMPNKEYSVSLACGVQCEQTTNACPTGLVCDRGYCGIAP